MAGSPRGNRLILLDFHMQISHDYRLDILLNRNNKKTVNNLDGTKEHDIYIKRSKRCHKKTIECWGNFSEANCIVINDKR